LEECKSCQSVAVRLASALGLVMRYHRVSYYVLVPLIQSDEDGVDQPYAFTSDIRLVIAGKLFEHLKAS